MAERRKSGKGVEAGVSIVSEIRASGYRCTNFSVLGLQNLLRHSFSAPELKGVRVIIERFCMVQDARRWPFQLSAQVIQGLQFFTKDARPHYPEISNDRILHQSRSRQGQRPFRQ